MSSKSKPIRREVTLRVGLSFAFIALLCLAVISHIDSSNGTPESKSEERTREDLQLRNGLLFDPETDALFEGVLVEKYPDDSPKVAIEIHGGRAHGKSKGYFENGQIEVDEKFRDGIAHGRRVRWHSNGKKRSEVDIIEGKLSGPFREWHQNGNKAVEMELVKGVADGVARAWHPSGHPKSRITYSAGKIVNQQHFPDNENPPTDLKLAKRLPGNR